MNENTDCKLNECMILISMLIINNPITFFVINNKYLCIIYLIHYGTIFVKQNYFAHISCINEQRDCDVASCR